LSEREPNGLSRFHRYAWTTHAGGSSKSNAVGLAPRVLLPLPRCPHPPTVNGNTVRSFSTHGHLSAAQGSSTTVSRSDIRLIQHFDSSALGLVRRWLLIGYFPIHLPPPHPGQSTAVGGPEGAVVVTFTEQALNVLSRRSPLPALHVRTQTPVSGELLGLGLGWW
jgi:hypothetical protein